jgi:hypothetical protein
MTGAAIALALISALCFGVALVLTHIGLRYIPPLPGAAISIPSSTLLFIAISPIVLGGRPIVWAAVPIFAAVGLLYPAQGMAPMAAPAPEIIALAPTSRPRLVLRRSGGRMS